MQESVFFPPARFLLSRAIKMESQEIDTCPYSREHKMNINAHHRLFMLSCVVAVKLKAFKSLVGSLQQKPFTGTQPVRSQSFTRGKLNHLKGTRHILGTARARLYQVFVSRGYNMMLLS